MKKFLSFLAVMITALFVLGACSQATGNETITVKIGLIDGSSTALHEPVAMSVPKGKKLADLLADPKVGAEIQKRLGLNESFQYTHGSDTYNVGLSKVYEDVQATTPFSADTVVEDGATGYLKATLVP